MSIEDIVVSTQNIWGFPNILRAKNNLKELLQVYNDYQPDVILLQEVFRQKWLDLDIIVNSYKPLYLTNPLFIEGGLVILIKKNLYDELQLKGYNYKLTYTEYNKQGIIRSHQFVSHISRKGYLKLELFNTSENNQTPVLIIINTHTTSAFNSKEELINKKLLLLIDQLNELFHHCKQYVNKKLIVGGDFNYDINRFMPDLKEQQYSIYPCNNETTLPKHQSTIDFICTKGFKNKKYILINNQNISDHNGILIKK
jgi:exonuclease III